MGIDPFILAIGGLLLGGIGTGVQYSAQMDAARTQEQFSLLNAQAGVQQATQQANMAAMQAQLQQVQSQTAQAAAQDNANTARQQTESEAAQAQENARRQREEFARALAAQNAQVAGSGVNVATGSPLDFLLNASEQQRQVEADTQWGIENERRAGYRKAAGIALGGRVEGLNADLYALDSMAALQQGQMGAAQARLNGLAGQAQAQGMRSGALGSLFGGIGGLTYQGATLWKNRTAQR
jgi:hypothetical protein